MEGKGKSVMSGIALGLGMLLFAGGLAMLGKSLGWYGKNRAGAETTPEVLNFEETGYGTYAVSLRDYTAKKVVIPGEHKGKAVTEIKGCSALPSIFERYVSNTSGLTDSQIKGNIEYFFMPGEFQEEVNDFGAVLGEIGFGAATELLRVEIPDSVKVIGACAFWGCASLTEVKLPGNIQEIGKNAFEYNFALTKVEWPENTQNLEIGSNLFSGCSNLTNLEIPKIETLPAGVFAKRVSGPVIIPEGVKHISANAFWGSTEITEIVLPSTLESIEPDAFRNCTNLKTVYNLSNLKIEAGVETYGGVAKNAENVYTELPSA